MFFRSYIIFLPDTLFQVATKDVLHYNMRRERGKKRKTESKSQGIQRGWGVGVEQRKALGQQAAPPALEMLIGASGQRCRQGCLQEKNETERVSYVFKYIQRFSVY